MKHDYNIEFAKRLEMACDNAPNVPEKNDGRQIWLRDRMEEEGAGVRIQSVNRWFTGVARPHITNMNRIAKILKVDPGWLSSGEADIMRERDLVKKLYIEGSSVNLITGMLQFKGFSVGYPDSNDDASKLEGVELFSIIRGRKINFATSNCKLDDDGSFSVQFSSHAVGKTTLVAAHMDDDYVVRAYEINGEWALENFEFKDAAYRGRFNPNHLPDEIQPFGEFMGSLLR